MLQIRQATRADVDVCFAIRLAVRENVLSNPAAITHDHYVREIELSGRGWVGQIDGAIRGFAVGRRTDGNIWALFVEPGFEGQGLGRALHDAMVAWLFAAGCTPLWLGTTPATRAERFYRNAGWRVVGPAPGGEIRMELTESRWRR